MGHRLPRCHPLLTARLTWIRSPGSQSTSFQRLRPERMLSIGAPPPGWIGEAAATGNGARMRRPQPGRLQFIDLRRIDGVRLRTSSAGSRPDRRAPPKRTHRTAEHPADDVQRNQSYSDLVTEMPKSREAENPAIERAAFGELMRSAVKWASATTLENNEKIRPQPDRENAFARASGGEDGTQIQPLSCGCRPHLQGNSEP